MQQAITKIVALLAVIFSAQVDMRAKAPNQENRACPLTKWTIVADKIDHPSANCVVGQGHVFVSIDGQRTSLAASKVTYNLQSTILKADGDVEILRKGMLTKGASFAFQIDSPDYLVTSTGTKLGEPILEVRP